MRLGTAGNTNGPALYLLEAVKQYIVVFDCDENSDFTQWIAIKGKERFFAESPEALLGLVSIYETFGDDWNRHSSYDLEHILKREISEFER